MMSKQEQAMSENVFKAIQAEMQEQEATWGTPEHHPETWVAIVCEETGEVARAALAKDIVQMKTELTQLAAACVMAINALEGQP